MKFTTIEKAHMLYSQGFSAEEISKNLDIKLTYSAQLINTFILEQGKNLAINKDEMSVFSSVTAPYNFDLYTTDWRVHEAYSKINPKNK